MKLFKCDKCGKILNPKYDEYFSIKTVKHINSKLFSTTSCIGSSSSSIFNTCIKEINPNIDFCKTCWEKEGLGKYITY